MNFFKLYKPIVNNWMFIDNVGEPYEIIAEGTLNNTEVAKPELWNHIEERYDRQ